MVGVEGAMKKGVLICFVGIDGSGKTTLAKYLVDEIQSRGGSASYVYGRYQPFLLRPVIFVGKLLFFRRKDRFNDYSGFAQTKKNAAASHGGLSRLYQRLLLAEYYLQLVWRMSLPLALSKRTIVSDRYIIDTVVTDLAVDFNYLPDEIHALIRRLHARFPKPDILVLIDLPEEIAMQRKTDTPSVDYLRERRGLYLLEAKGVGARIIDGSLPLDEIKRQVRQLVEVRQP